ncbi:flagellar motor switch protein FliN [Iodidimonas nitroreducens]|uniref:Flagellar motor switch protein FliN n=1 Tax=Iodidimonas nitroreducens TaxID=1236968 RepID=A0A5A7N7P9_9PROT|nr:flagellar motor switch protein FliN [Iodidimonas nitroreducens]GAK33067.1 flagellar motor switch protein FliN [alpha proteobacterium Q-1]GER03410.1 flagellar motor switch protein FliN [Iodidimonas nitroreducens]
MADTDNENDGSEKASTGVDYQELQSAGGTAADEDSEQRTAHDLEPVFDVPVRVQAILGRANLEVSQLLKLAPGAVLELDRKIGEAIDIYVNNRLVARGEVVLVEDHLGVTMTEIIKTERA